MWRILCNFLILPLLIRGALVENHVDRVHKLPGYDSPLPSAWYSGFLNYELDGHQIHTHYIFVEAEKIEERTSKSSPTPIIYWSNGGPGASSMFGLLTELGPLILSDDSLLTPSYRETGIPTLLYNTHSWTRLGHLLIFDAPAPVGYSHCDNNQNHSECSVSWTDELASENTFLAFQTFLHTKFPVLLRAPIYLTGESYAGIYIPTLARRMVQQNEQDHKSQKPVPSFNLQGFAVGDGCLGTETGICGSLSGRRFDYWLVLFLAGHGQIPLSTYHQVLTSCGSGSSSIVDPSLRKLKNMENDLKDACQEALDKVQQEVGGYYEYSLYDECGSRNGLLTGAENDYPCGGGVVMEQYVNLQVVKDALNSPNATYFSVDNAENFDYTPTEKDISDFYKSQVGKLKMLVYNGDTDPAITSFAAQNWTSHLNLQEWQSWRPWTIDGCQQMGGYVIRYDGGLDFLTIRGAGHLVPTYKPKAAFVMMKNWIDGIDYPHFSTTTTNQNNNNKCVGSSKAKLDDTLMVKSQE